MFVLVPHFRQTGYLHSARGGLSAGVLPVKFYSTIVYLKILLLVGLALLGILSWVLKVGEGCYQMALGNYWVCGGWGGLLAGFNWRIAVVPLHFGEWGLWDAGSLGEGRRVRGGAIL